MIVIVVFVFAVMVVGNAVLASSARALYGTYARLISGDLSVSARADSNYTVFGSDQLLIGEYLVAPVIPNYEEIVVSLSGVANVRATAGLVTGAAAVTIDGVRRNRTFFGVDFDAYRELVPELELVAGRWPDPGEAGILVQELNASANGNPVDLIGRPALLASGSGRNFALREVPVAGVFRYPVDDELLATVVLVDAGTARALNGYVYGALDEIEIAPETQETLEIDVDELFGTVEPLSDTATETSVVDIDAILGSGDSTAPIDAAPADRPAPRDQDRARQAIAGAWNFLLVSLEDPGERQTVIRRIEADGYNERTGYRVRDWYRTVGGNATLVRYLRLLFNAGLAFVALGAAIIATNALMLSILERTAEIGTMRALGAGRARVALLISVETMIVVVGSAALGIASGAVVVSALNDAAYVASNRYIAILFGGEPLRGLVTWTSITRHVVAGMALGTFALLYPLRRALAISPREAMVT